MSIANFVPEIWSTLLLRHLDASLVLSSPRVVNTAYEGEITQQGDTVHIQKIGSVTVKEYSKGTPIDGPEQATSSTVALTIDEAYYWNIGVKSVDAVQANVNLLEPRLERAGYELATVIDSSVAATMVANAGIDDGLGTAGAPLGVGNGSGETKMFDLAVEMRRLLDVNNAPASGRWIAIHPDLEATVLTDDRFVNTSSEIGSEAVRSGAIGGSIAGFEVLKTTAVPLVNGTGGANDSYGILFGAGNYATTHAHQLTDVRAYEVEADFEDAVKSLAIWGTKVVEPESLGVALVDAGATDLVS